MKELPIINVKDIMPSNKDELKCGPDLEFENGSCIPLNILVDMAEAYNKYCKDNNKDDKIKLNSRLDTLYPDEYKKYLLHEFKMRYNNNQKDWIKKNFTEYMSDESKHILENIVFRPEGPQGKFDWLSTIDINKVLFQYESKYIDFKFLGAVPMDFNDLDYLPFKDIEKYLNKLYGDKIYRIGVIFNTDESYKSGKHWISLFADLHKGQIYYSDSYGIRPEQRVIDLINRIEKFIESKGITDIDIRYNKTQHQKGNSECGVYSINFILRLLKGKTFDHITRKRLTDEKVNKCRVVYFGK